MLRQCSGALTRALVLKLFGKALAENKVKKLCWLLSLGRILTVDKLIWRGWQGSEICSMCDSHEESAEHLLLNCFFAREVWRRITSWSGLETLSPEDGLEGGHSVLLVARASL